MDKESKSYQSYLESGSMSSFGIDPQLTVSGQRGEDVGNYYHLVIIFIVITSS